VASMNISHEFIIIIIYYLFAGRLESHETIDYKKHRKQNTLVAKNCSSTCAILSKFNHFVHCLLFQEAKSSYVSFRELMWNLVFRAELDELQKARWVENVYNCI